MYFQLLDRTHDRRSFQCSNEELNEYFHQIVSQDMKNRLSRCYVLCNSDTDIIGFYTLSNASIEREELSAFAIKQRYEQVPFVLLGRLAVDIKYERQGYGTILAQNAILRVLASELCPVGLYVDMKNENL